jgi:hypothetical protein
MAVETSDIREAPRRRYYELQQEEIVANLEKAKLAEQTKNGQREVE